MLKYILVSLCVLSLAVVIYFFILGRISQQKSFVVVSAQKLVQCPATPNCVCSEYPQDDDHFVAPIELPSASFDFSLAKAIVAQMGAEILSDTQNHLHAIFKSTLFGFVDDFELRFDPATSQLHVRSSSRVGRSDLGANGKRVETFRQALTKTLAGS